MPPPYSWLFAGLNQNSARPARTRFCDFTSQRGVSGEQMEPVQNVERTDSLVPNVVPGAAEGVARSTRPGR
jgi:hypothetical protein